MVTAGAAYEYETQDIYDDGNRVKIADTPAGYYRLEKPEKIDNIVKANLGLGLQYDFGYKTRISLEYKYQFIKDFSQSSIMAGIGFWI